MENSSQNFFHFRGLHEIFKLQRKGVRKFLRNFSIGSGLLPQLLSGCKAALLPPPLTMATGNLVNLKKTSEMSPIKDEFLASYSKQNF